MSEPIPIEELTPEQKSQWADTRSMMAWSCPGFRHIFYKLLSNNNGEHFAVPTRSVPIAATDAQNILINPDTFFKYTLRARVFIAAHEIVHNVYGDVELLHRCQTSGSVPMHDGTTLPFDNGTMQQAMDYRINALLVESRIGEMPSDKGVQVGIYDLKVAGPNDSVLDVYKKIYDPKKCGGGPSGFDQLLAPGTSTGQTPQQAVNGKNQQQWSVEIAAAQTIEQARAQGKMSGALQRMFKELLEPEVPWTEHIRSIVNRRVGSGSYNWRRPDRRFIMRDLHMPSRSGHGAGWLVAWGDTSGSIGASELNSYLGEFGGIIEDVKPKRLTILWCDSEIKFIDEIYDMSDLYHVKCRGVGGGGGTSVKPVFNWIVKNNTETPDMFLGFTDGFVTFPTKEPAFPVIWASITDSPYPWGEVVRINKRAK